MSKDNINNKNFSTNKLGDKLVKQHAITEKQLELALNYQKKYGGRLGDVLISFDYITKENLSKFIENSNKKKPLGKMLVDNSIITEEQLKEALAFQEKSGGLIGDILLSLNMVKPKDIYSNLATQQQLGRMGDILNFNDASKLPFVTARKYGLCIVNTVNNRYLLAVVKKLSEVEIEDVEAYLDKPVEQVLASQYELDNYWNMVYGNDLTEESVSKLNEDQPQNSAKTTFTVPQLTAVGVIAVLLLLSFLISWVRTFIVINILLQVVYLSITLMKFSILLKGTKESSQIYIDDNEVDKIDEKELPIYTILIPLYKEKDIAGKLCNSIEKLNYPKQKLDVRLLLEEDDSETQEVINSLDLPAYYKVLIVPESFPKTKPKACNYGLIRARGEYVVIYDAEDIPDPDQLKKVYLGFKKLPEKNICIQCKLNYFNSNQNILTKWFTQEYSMWFEMLLPGVVNLDIPVPLGGTSNHFKTNYLKQVGAWDPFNVTEDADLGVRLFKEGYTTSVLDSHTWEEANSRFFNWIRQRSRWIKGYMQTWLVHMRNPINLFKELGLRGFWGFQAMIGASFLLPLANPFLWLMLILWYMTKASWIPQLFPGPTYYISAFLLILGNFIFVYSNVVGMFWVINDMEKKDKKVFSYGMLKYALLTPIYWSFSSLAAIKALWQLIHNPFHWEKTDHGLSGSSIDNIPLKNENKSDN
ncbi:MAG: glycosyltransferase family 2 protein [Clostridium sp.]|nr:glycosyltransferase family 2 protein [Clostridium sp.]